jgi:hypothetical protein
MPGKDSNRKAGQDGNRTGWDWTCGTGGKRTVTQPDKIIKKE